MINYAFSFVLVLALAGCKPPEARSFVCFNPFNPIQSFQIDTAFPKVEEHRSSLELKDDSGQIIFVPKSLCIEVINAKSN